MDQGVSLYIDPTGAETGGRVIKRTFKEIGDAAIDAQQKINRTAGVVQEAARSAEASFRVIAQQQDAMREKYDQAFAAQQRYARAIEGINDAQRLGAITASQRIDATIRETNALNSQINTMSRLAQTRKESAQASVDKLTITPNRGADIAAYAAQLDALQAKFDPLYAASLRYKNILSEIDNAQRVGAISASQAIDLRIREKASLDAVTNASERLVTQQKQLAEGIVRSQTISPDRGADIVAYGQQLEALRQKYNPLYAAGQQYRQTVDEIRQAHRVGAISTDEMTAALARERQAVRENVAAITGQNRALEQSAAARKSNLSSLNSSNLVAQFQDVGVTAAMGMSPLQIGLQQGTQMALVFDQMKASGLGMASTLRAAFVQLISPISLITVGLTVGAAALIQYFGSVWPKAKSADDAIKQHAESIKSIKDAYGEAAKGLSDYVGKSQAEAASAARNNLKVQTESLKQLAKEFSDSLNAGGSGLTGGSQFQVPDVTRKFAPFKAAIDDLRKSMRDGTPDFITFRRNIEETVAADPKNLQVLGDKLIEMSGAASDAGRRVQSARMNVLGLGDVAAAQASGVDTLKTALTELSQIALPALNDADRAMKAYREAMAAAKGSEDRSAARLAYDAALKRIDNTQVESDGRKIPIPTPEARPVGLGEDPTSKLLSLSNVDVSPTVKGVNTLSQSVVAVGAAASQSTISLNGLVQASTQSTSGVVDVTRQLNDAKRAQVMGFEQQGQQLRTFQVQLTEVKKTLEDAANIAPADVFGENIAGGAEAIASAVTNVQKLFQAMDNGQKGVLDVHDGLAKIRAQLIAMGGDAKAVDRFMDSLINANVLVGNLESSVKSLSQSIMGIPNRTISIGIQQYQVPTAGGGTKGINVYGAGADMTANSYNVGGGKTVGVYGGNGIYPSLGSKGGLVDPYDTAMMNLTLGYGGARAAGGPTEAGKTYLVGENGPELMQMSGPGQVTNTNSTAALLSGGRDTLSLIEDHLNSAVQELKIHTNYFETYESDFTGIATTLKGLKTGVDSLVTSAKSSVSYSSSGGGYGGSGGSSAKKNGGYGKSGSYDPLTSVDYSSPYQGPGITYTNGTGAIGYATYNITPSILGTQHNPGLRPGPTGQFATGGQIMPGEDQKVELFKRSKERVIIVDDNKVSDRRGGGADPAAARSERPVHVTANFYGGAQSDARSRQQQMDEIRRTVQQAIRS